jgi:iron complex outermembrane receptor protein
MKRPITTSLASLAIALSSSASAQESPVQGASPETQAAADSADAGGLADIVVTAQRRSQNAQDVPIAISAITADALQAKGISDVASIGGQAPNVTLKSTASFGGSSSILVSYIRGIGQNDFAFNLEPGVGVYIDGVYLARNIGANVDLLDLERVEVLKGPQGTLFGRNTIGGALNIATRDPGDEWKVKAEATTGSYNRIDVRAAIDAPLIPGILHASFAGSTKHRKGYQRRIPYSGHTDQNPIYLAGSGGAFGGPTNINTDESVLYPVTDLERATRSGNQNQTAFRAKLLFTPSDRLRIRLIGDYLNVDQAAAPFSLLQVNQQAYVAIYNSCIIGNQSVIAAVGVQTGFGAGIGTLCNSIRGNAGSPTGTQPSLSSQAGFHLPYDNRFVITNPDGSVNPDLSYASGANYDKIDNYGINGQIEYDLTDQVKLKSITAYRRLDSKFGADIGGAPFSALNPTFSDKENQFSQELQILGKIFDNRWNFVLGGYYFHEYGSHSDKVPFTGGLIQIHSNDSYDTKSYAAFIHNNIDLIPGKLGITLGARYTHEDKSFTGSQRDENAFGVKLLGLPPSVLPVATDIYRVYPVGRNAQKFDNFSYRVGAEYHLDRRAMVYASYATAFKGGGWTTRLTLPNFDPVTFAPLPAPTFGPEKAKTAEIGLKSELLDRHVRLNIAVFRTDYDNIQLTFQNGSSPVTANGGDGRIQGVEAELNAAITRSWSLDASVGYLDARYTRILPGVPLTGTEKFVNTPDWSAQAGTSYRLETGAGAFTPRLDWIYTARIYNDEANTPLLSTAPRSMFNGSLTYQLPDDRFELQLGVTNIFDKRFIQSGYTNSLAIYSATFNRPREWFLTLRVHN